MASIGSIPNVDDYVIVVAKHLERYNIRADTDQHPIHIEDYANNMWSPAIMDLEIVPIHSDIDTQKYIDLGFLRANNIVLYTNEQRKKTKIKN